MSSCFDGAILCLDQVFSVSLEDDAPFRPSMIWWIGISIMLCAVAMACTVPDPRLLRAGQHRQVPRQKVGNSDLSESLVGGEGLEEGEASLYKTVRTPKTSLLDRFYMWVAGL